MRSRSAPNAAVGVMQAVDWKMTVDLMKAYQELKTDLAADAFYTNDLLPK